MTTEPTTAVELPAPKPFATTTVFTNSGNVTVICEPINEWLAITPVFGMDADGNSLLDGTFTITHIPTGRYFVDGSGCVHCCRRAGAEIAALGLDLSALTGDNGTALAEATDSDTCTDWLVRDLADAVRKAVDDWAKTHPDELACEPDVIG